MTTGMARFNIGDKVWMISNNRALQIDVTGVGISVDKNGSHTLYTLHFDKDVEESKLYGTKEELLKSL